MGGQEPFAEYVNDANEALIIRLMRRSDGGDPEPEEAQDGDEDLQDPYAFHPEMTHQVYGEAERIFGYRFLSIECLFSAGSLKAFIKYKCKEELPPNNEDDVKPDPIAEPLLKILAEDQVAPNEVAFYAEVDKETAFKPMGDKISEWKIKDRTFECYHNTNKTKGFSEYLARAQPFIMFFIDAASYIDIDDHRWQVFLIFER